MLDEIWDMGTGRLKKESDETLGTGPGYANKDFSGIFPQKIRKPPIGLRPKKISNKDRKIEILEAMIRYVNGFKKIPAEWVDELIDLNNSEL